MRRKEKINSKFIAFILEESTDGMRWTMTVRLINLISILVKSQVKMTMRMIKRRRMWRIMKYKIILQMREKRLIK